MAQQVRAAQQHPAALQEPGAAAAAAERAHQLHRRDQGAHVLLARRLGVPCNAQTHPPGLNLRRNFLILQEHAAG